MVNEPDADSTTMKMLLRRFDGFQQRHSFIGFPVAVMKKFVEDKCPSLAALLAYYGLLSIFPLLLVLFTLLALFFGHDTNFQHRVIHSALAQFPVIGKQLGNLGGQASLHKRSGIGLALGLLGLLWGSLGVTKAGQRAMADIWNVPHLLRPHFIRRIASGLEFLGVLILDVVLSTALAGLVTSGGHALWFKIIAVVVGLALNVSLFMLGFRILTPKSIATRMLVTGAGCAALGWSFLQYIGTWLVGHELRHASQLYGYFASVLGLVFFLYVAAVFTVIAAEIDVVRIRHLYPRSLLAPPLTSADERVLTDLAMATQRRVDEVIEVRFATEGDTDDSTTIVDDGSERDPAPNDE
jgi:YihY family inner membrane protein